MTGFLGSTILEVAMGITFVYLVMAVFCSTANEWIAGLLDARATNLEQALRQLLDNQTAASGKSFLDAFYAHPIITGLMKGKRQPSYVPSRSFALTVMDLVTTGVEGLTTFKDLQDGIRNMPQGDVRTALLALLQNAGGDLDRAQRNIEGWFDDTMDRASGWYRRKTQVWTILIAMALTVAINADSVNIAKQLWTSPTARAAIVARAGIQASGNQTPDPKANAQEIDRLGQLIGWSSTAPLPVGTGEWITRILGWILTITAVSMGAPFWFDVLNKVVNLRDAGKSPSESSKSPEKPIAPPADKLA